MHAIKLPPSILERANDRVAEISVDPSRLAHVVIDLQNGFVAPGGSVEVAMCREIAPNVNRISAAVREAGGLNVFIRFTVDPDEAIYWRSLYGRMRPEAMEGFMKAFHPGAEEHALWPGLEVTSDDLVVDKTRFSAFIPGTCDLHRILQELEIDTLIITGTLTNCCCESTVRDAMQMGYQVLFAHDGNAAFDDDTHNATLANLAGLMFADVLDTDAIIARVKAGAAARPAQ